LKQGFDMNNAALAKALESAQLVELDPGPGSRASPANEALTPSSSDAKQPPPTAAARDMLNALWQRASGATPEPLLRHVEQPPPTAAASGTANARWRQRTPLGRLLRAPVAMPPSVVLPLPPSAAPRGLMHALWLRLFGPPAIDPRTITRNFGAFRAFYEVGSDYLPNSGTWPSAGAVTSDRS
jgi:hypothetical protein